MGPSFSNPSQYYKLSVQTIPIAMRWWRLGWPSMLVCFIWIWHIYEQLKPQVFDHFVEKKLPQGSLICTIIKTSYCRSQPVQVCIFYTLFLLQFFKLKRPSKQLSGVPFHKIPFEKVWVFWKRFWDCPSKLCTLIHLPLFGWHSYFLSQSHNGREALKVCAGKRKPGLA